MLAPVVGPAVVQRAATKLERSGPPLVIIDCRFDLADKDAGKGAYAAGHIPGAVYADLERDLSAPVMQGRTGRHPLPSVDAFVDRLRAWGVNDDSQVLVYDDRTGAIAARLWWMLRWVGHDAVSVLDGGYQGWLAVSGEPSIEVPAPVRGRFTASVRSERIVSTDDVLRRGSGYVLLDARNAERYRGEVEPIDPVRGHIPGAVCFPFVDNLDETGKFRSPEELRARFSKLIGHTPPEQVVVYCGSGVTACHHVLAAAYAGVGELRLYAGSFSEWITDPDRAVATGDE